MQDSEADDEREETCRALVRACLLAENWPLRRKRVADGRSFRDLVHNIRMSDALTLLPNTKDPVLHVAVAAAYASSSRLAARFRARDGYLPTDIRGQNRSC